MAVAFWDYLPAVGSTYHFHGYFIDPLTMVLLGEHAIALQPQLWLIDALAWVKGLGVGGAIAFILLYILATISFLPGFILTLGAGVLYGVVPGALYVWIGATLGGTCAFLIGRYLARGWVTQQLANYPQFATIDTAVSQAGFKIVLLTRLSPIFPFNLLNYAFGVTGVSLTDYLLGSIGMIPGTLLYVYLGSLAGNLATLNAQSPAVPPAVQGIGFLFTALTVFYVTRLAQRALQQSLPPSP